MNTLLGLVMIYAWIHSIVLCFKHLKGITTYEKVVLWIGLASFALFVIGRIN